ncbi:MAG TPA: hypothetical protein VIS54_09290 [Psychromonas sp.]
MAAVSGYQPKEFLWNTANIQWLKNYLTQKTPELNRLTNGVGIDITHLNLLQFDALCALLEKTAEGRELRTRMFKAWRSKKSRDSNNGKKSFTFNLDIEAGSKLKKLAKNRAINKTLEELIYGTYQSAESLRQEAKQLKAQQKSDKIQQSVQDELRYNYEVKELAGLEKSELIRTILKLNKQLKENQEKLKEKQLRLTQLQQDYDLLKC